MNEQFLDFEQGINFNYEREARFEQMNTIP